MSCLASYSSGPLCSHGCQLHFTRRNFELELCTPMTSSLPLTHKSQQPPFLRISRRALRIRLLCTTIKQIKQDGPSHETQSLDMHNDLIAATYVPTLPAYEQRRKQECVSWLSSKYVRYVQCIVLVPHYIPFVPRSTYVHK